MTDQTTTPVWLLLALVSKSDAISRSWSAMLGWRVMASEQEAKGSFLERVNEAKSGFAIEELLCVQLPEEAMRAALGKKDQTPMTDQSSGRCASCAHWRPDWHAADMWPIRGQNSGLCAAFSNRHLVGASAMAICDSEGIDGQLVTLATFGCCEWVQKP